jgi:DNA-directed RNA polymerase subunit M/transcription elongation factor TFIIS
LEFCERCEGMLLPKKDKKATILYCPHCGFEKEIKKKDDADYKVIWKIKHTPRDEIIVVEGKKRGKKDKEVLKEEMEDYYRSMLEFYPEEGD